MSAWNIELRDREEIIEVRQILKTYEKYVVGLPAMEILDQNGREHMLTAVDFSSQSWNRIQEGSKIKIILRESVVNSVIL